MAPPDAMTSPKRIVLYCQHLSGAGHYVRSREIVRALSRRHQVRFVAGGRPVPGPGLSDSVHHVQLPTIYRSSVGLTPVDATRAIEDVFADRQRILERELLEFRPDVFIIEHFPFSKWDLRSELLAAIKAARAANPRVRVLSSVRDHPAGHEASSPPESYRSAVLPTLNEHFTALLVHSDRRVVRLESQFSWVPEIVIPIHHTGYVSEKVNDRIQPAGPTSDGLRERYVLVSSGGLVDGFRLANLCSAAWLRLYERGLTGGRRMVIFAGLFAEPSQYDALARTLRDGPFGLHRFSSDFLRWMPAADLSISQGGYNTVMNVLETRTRAILAPNRRTADQPLRARTLAEQGVVDVIDPATISVERMADRIVQGLSRPRPRHDIALDGAERTRDVIESL